MSTSNGTHPSAHSADEAIDLLYAWYPPAQTAVSCPEAIFSLTLKGRLDGQEALLTARGQTAAEFKANLQAIRGLLDPVPQPASPQGPTQGQGKDYCPIHQVTMQETTKDGRRWFSHRTDDGWCKGRK